MTEDTPDTAGGRIAIGVDVGGSGIKAAVVDVDSGRFVSERLRVPTPSPSTPEAIALRSFAWSSGSRSRPALDNSTPVGLGLPGVTIDGVLKFAANIDQSWIDFPIVDRLSRSLKRPVSIINDADAAGIAEMRFGDRRRRARSRHLPDTRDWRRVRCVQQRRPRPEHRVRADGDPRPPG